MFQTSNIGSISLCCCHWEHTTPHRSVRFLDALLWDLGPCNLQCQCQVLHTLKLSITYCSAQYNMLYDIHVGIVCWSIHAGIVIVVIMNVCHFSQRGVCFLPCGTFSSLGGFCQNFEQTLPFKRPHLERMGTLVQLKMGSVHSKDMVEIVEVHIISYLLLPFELETDRVQVA